MVTTNVSRCIIPAIIAVYSLNLIDHIILILTKVHLLSKISPHTFVINLILVLSLRLLVRSIRLPTRTCGTTIPTDSSTGNLILKSILILYHVATSNNIVSITY